MQLGITNDYNFQKILPPTQIKRELLKETQFVSLKSENFKSLTNFKELNSTNTFTSSPPYDFPIFLAIST